MRDYIRSIFDVQKPFPYEDEEYIVFSHNGKETMLYLPMFLDYCNGLKTPLTAEQLKAVDPDDSRGWFSIFENWKKKGILN